jgi:hypothetical protein
MGFTGGGPPIMKTKQRWWENPQFMKIEKDDEIVEKAVENQAAAYEIVMRHAGVLDEENIPSDQD